MSFLRYNRWRLLLIALLTAVTIFGSVKLIEEEKAAAPAATPAELNRAEQMLAAIKDTVRQTAVEVTDWSKKIDILLEVPFVSQAPTGHWDDQRQQEGCEEASTLMAIKWAKGEAASAKADEAIIAAMADWQTEHYGSYINTNAQDTVKRLLIEYFKYDQNKITVVKLEKAEQIIDALTAGQLVLLPANGRKLQNPYYTAPGPLTHMLVVRGYDRANNEFITNDPGTKRGAKYRYPADRLLAAAWNYPTGSHLTEQIGNDKFMIIISQ